MDEKYKLVKINNNNHNHNILINQLHTRNRNLHKNVSCCSLLLLGITIIALQFKSNSDNCSKSFNDCNNNIHYLDNLYSNCKFNLTNIQDIYIHII